MSKRRRQRSADSPIDRREFAERPQLDQAAARLRARTRRDFDNTAGIGDLLITRDDKRRILRTAEEMLAAAATSTDAEARERATRLVDMVCRIAALLHRLSAGA